MDKNKLTLEEKRQVLRRIAKRYHFDIVEPYDLELFFKAHNYCVIGELRHHLAGESVRVHTSFVNASYPKYDCIISPYRSISTELRKDPYIKDLTGFIKDEELATIVDFSSKK